MYIDRYIHSLQIYNAPQVIHCFTNLSHFLISFIFSIFSAAALPVKHHLRCTDNNRTVKTNITCFSRVLGDGCLVTASVQYVWEQRRVKLLSTVHCSAFGVRVKLTVTG